MTLASADRSPDTRARNGDFELLHRLGPSTWLARIDGRVVDARPVTTLPEPLPLDGMPDELVPLRGGIARNGHNWLISEHVPGVSLHRLLIATSLSPAQAAYLAAGVLTALARLHRAGRAHTRLTPSNVLVGMDGTVRLADWAPAALDHRALNGDAHAADLSAARELIAELARNADRPVAHHNGNATLIARLEHFATDDGGLGAAAAAEQLAAALPSPDEVQADLALLVTALCNQDHHPSLEPPHPTWHEPIRIPRTVPRGSLTPANWPPQRRRLWPWIVAVLIVIALCVAGYFLARNQITSFTEHVLHRAAAVQFHLDGSAR